MATDNERVRDYYDSDPQREWDRLGAGSQRIEYALTMRALEEYLPEAPATVLDIGGGPGRYAIELARRGYDVTLADLSSANLDFARERAVEGGAKVAAFEHADARDLSRFQDASFDAVTLMGPLYHLLEAADRAAAIKEALRVVRPGGRLFAAFVTRYSPLRWWGKNQPTFVPPNRRFFDEMFATGQAPDAPGFTDLYMERPEAIAPFIETFGAHTLTIIGCEGVVSMIQRRISELTGDDWDYWVDVNYRLSKDPSTHGIAEHLLYVGEKPPP